PPLLTMGDMGMNHGDGAMDHAGMDHGSMGHGSGGMSMQGMKMRDTTLLPPDVKVGRQQRGVAHLHALHA
ncbi:hypothetical protein, partial [Erythrobacter donghaensis]|uniref:hypothetical protein n=1 Tax=Erythrobacter donghaensis TaxID=267135 RepID=UPI000A682268